MGVDHSVRPCKVYIGPHGGLYFLLAGRVRVSRRARGRERVLHGESARGVLGGIPVLGGATFGALAVLIETRLIRRTGRSRFAVVSPEALRLFAGR